MGFWPNPYGETHHRSDAFHQAYRCTQRRLRSLFQLDTESWEILLIPLSGSLTIESVIRTFGGTVDVRTTGAFSERVGTVHQCHQAPWKFGVLYETNDSRLCDVSDCDIVDAVSALPYFSFPHEAQAVITVSSKQFGGSTVWSAVFLRRDFWDHVDPLEGYLDLQRYRHFERRAETPCTPPIEGLFSLAENLADFDLSVFRQRIDERYQRARSVILAAGGEVIGSAPVLTFRLAMKPSIDSTYHEGIPDEWLWVPHDRKDWLQAFLWSGSDAQFDRWLELIEVTHTHGVSATE